MRIRRLFPGILLFALIVLRSAAQVPAACVTAVKGTVRAQLDLSNSYKEVAVGQWLQAGMKITLASGSSVSFRRDRKGAEPETREATFVVEPLSAEEAARWKWWRSDRLRLAARSQGTGGLLQAPEKGRFRVGKPITLRWWDPGEGTITLRVGVDGVGEIWRKECPADVGKDTPDELPQILLEEIAKGRKKFRFACDRASSPTPMWGCVMTPLSPDEERTLEADLEECGPPGLAWHHALRAAAYAGYGLHENAMGEIERAMNIETVGEDPSFQELARLVRESAGRPKSP